MEKIRILIADDHAILRDGLKMALKTDPAMEVIGEAENGEIAVKLEQELRPDIIVMDVDMPKMNGIEAVRAIKKKNPDAKVLMLTMHDKESYIVDSISAGAAGYIYKMADMDEFINAVKTVACGKEYFNEKVSQSIMSNYIKSVQKKEEDGERHFALTNREIEIVKLIAAGFTSQEIAEKLFISYFTVGKHRKNIMKKLELKNTAELVRYAMKEGYVKQEN
ncbi:MAG TPA: response regulator transcription factor [Ignavibacteriales bacterium]|nr:response regulator transcription factor [Ignavibacteriales bacterium]